MLSTLQVVLPVFALIFVGWLARRAQVLGPQATSELNRFVVWLALPALLFDIVANADWNEIWQPGFIATFGLSAGIVFALTVVLRLRGPRKLPDASIDALNAAYANTGYMGFPLALMALGHEALAPTLIASIITVCVVFAVAIVLVEIGLQTEIRGVRLLLKVGGSLIRNPLLVAPLLGGLVPLSGAAIPVPMEQFLKLLGGAASPCALVALGLFLARKSDQGEADIGSTTLLVLLKLVLQPALAWVLADLVFGLPAPMTHAAVLLAALPTGTGPFMVAEYYRREAETTSKVVLVSTVLSVFTVSAYLAVAL